MKGNERGNRGRRSGERILAGSILVLLFLASCTKEAWNNPHGLLGGLFSPSSPSSPSGGTAPVAPSPQNSGSPGATGATFGKLDPPTFSHVVPFPEGDGLYLQWRPVNNVSDYLVYNGNRLIADVPTNRIRINGLLPCTQYMLRIYSSDGTRVSKNGLLVRVHTRGCLPVPH